MCLSQRRCRRLPECGRTHIVCAVRACHVTRSTASRPPVAMTRRQRPGRVRSALAMLAALAPRCAGCAEAPAALSLALGAASAPALAGVRCEYACDGGACSALLACTPADAHGPPRCTVRFEGLRCGSPQASHTPHRRTRVRLTRAATRVGAGRSRRCRPLRRLRAGLRCLPSARSHHAALERERRARRLAPPRGRESAAPRRGGRRAHALRARRRRKRCVAPRLARMRARRAARNTAHHIHQRASLRHLAPGGACTPQCGPRSALGRSLT